MSAANRGGERIESDFYGTPEWCVLRLLEKCHFNTGRPWFEPFAGDGAVIRAVRQYYGNVGFFASELREKEHPGL